jgi:membrane peptidoglycan carboxypeptidase
MTMTAAQAGSAVSSAPPGRVVLPSPPDGRPPRRRRHRPRKLLAIVGLICCAGLLSAVIAAPIVVGGGLLAKSASDHFDDLPTTLPVPTLGRDSVILAADGSKIATLHGPENRIPVTIGQVAPIMKTAIVDIEDSRFYTHHGIDFRGLARAAFKDSDGGQQGGSTITQQYVKNVLLYTADTSQEAAAATDRSIARKLREARLAVALEQKWSKDQILEGYLNIAYFGHGAYGIGAAAKRYFGTTVDKLNVDQAALLAGLVQSPSATDPIDHPKAAMDRRNVVLQRMEQLGHLTAAQEKFAAALPLGLNPVAPPPTADPCLESTASFFCDWVRTQLLNNPALGDTPELRQQHLFQGGLTIRTTLDPAIQAAAQQAVDSTVEPSNKITVAEAIVQPGTGNVVAMAVNKPYGTNPGQTTIPLLTTPALQPGSTFKMFTMAAALNQGLPLSTTFNSPGCYVSQLYKKGTGGTQPLPDCSNGFTNADPAEAGNYNMVNGTWDSVNTYYIQLEEKVGVKNVADMAVRLGVPMSRFTQKGNNVYQDPNGFGSLTLGAIVVSPLDMATAYATVAAGGLRCDPRGVAGATGPDGKAVALTPAAACQQVIPKSEADTITSVLEGVITNGTGYPNASLYGRPAAGKTGTTDDHVSAWFVGYTPQLAAAVEVGVYQGPSKNPLQGVYVNGQYWSSVFGGDLPAIAWSQSMRNALANQPYASLPPPAGG